MMDELALVKAGTRTMQRQKFQVFWCQIAIAALLRYIELRGVLWPYYGFKFDFENVGL